MSYWSNGDYRLASGDLLFSQRFAGMGTWLHGYAFPSLDRQTALENNPDRIGEEFLFASGHDPVEVLAAGRLMITLLGLVLGIFVFAWAYRVFGDTAALGALALFVFCPPIIANASIVTTDLTTTLWFTIAVVAYWRLLETPSNRRGIFAGVALGALLLAKASAVGFAAIAVSLAVWRLWRGPRPLPWMRVLAAHAMMVGALVVTVWAFFGFTARPGEYEHAWETLGPGTRVYRAIAALREFRVFPDPFLWEISGVRHLVTKRYSYFAGEHYYGGSWGFFPAAFLFKTPPATLALFAIAATLSIWTWRTVRAQPSADAARDWPIRSLVPLWIIALGYAALCIASRVNIGHRHLLPIYPALCVLGGGAFAWLLRRGRAHAIGGVALLSVTAVEATVFHGRQLAYFSPLAGGPKNGHRWFIDSTNDWGANLPEIAALQRTLLARDPAANFYIGHLGVFQIEAYGVRGTALRGREEMDQLRGGYYILSASALRMGYVFQPGPFTARHETDYQEALDAAKLGTETESSRNYRRRLAAARLSAFCRHRTPDTRIGDVYFVFQLSEAEVERALRGPPTAGVPEPEQHSR